LLFLPLLLFDDDDDDPAPPLPGREAFVEFFKAAPPFEFLFFRAIEVYWYWYPSKTYLEGKI